MASAATVRDSSIPNTCLWRPAIHIPGVMPASVARIHWLDMRLGEFPIPSSAEVRYFASRTKHWGVWMYTQRKKERRSFERKVSFPLLTSGGCRVESDRRSIPDRRLGNIHLELIDDAGYGLPDYLSNSALFSSGKEDYW